MTVRVRDFQASDFQGTEFVDLFVSKPYAGSFEGVVTPVTLTADALVAINATTITLDVALTEKILKRTELTFGSSTVIVTADASVGATSLSVEPVEVAIAANATATYSGLVPVFSLTQANDSMNTEVLEDQVFRSGFWKTCRTTSGKLELQCQGKVIKSDPGLTYVKDAGRSGQKLYFRLVSEALDEKIEGWAFPMNVNVSRQNKQNQDISFNLSVDGKPTFGINS